MALATILLITASLLFGAQADYEFTIVENAGENNFVGVITIPTGATELSFLGPEADNCNRFFVIESSGSIRTNGSIDRELVEDTTGSDIMQCIVHRADKVTINILDENDNEPRFFELEQPQIETLSENAPINQELLRLEPIDKDKGENGTTRFNITSGNEGGHFAIETPLMGDEDSPWRILVLKNSLTTGNSNIYFELVVTIEDMGVNPLEFEQVIRINIEPPDEPPTFAVTSVVYNIPENYSVGSEYSFQTLTASNVDQVHGDIVYSIEGGDASNDLDIGEIVNVNKTTGELYLNQSLDFEEMERIEFRVIASNPSSNSFDDIFVTINVEDVNDNPPRCDDSCNLVRRYIENSTIEMGFPIIDDDITAEFRKIQESLTIYSTDPNVLSHLSFNKTSFLGTISIIRLTIEPLDREEISDFNLTVTFFNEAEPFLSGSITTSVTILDINDNKPQFVQENFNVRVAEGSPLGKEISLLEAIDEDAGRNGTITYAIESIDKPVAETWFHLSPTNGTLFVASSGIDYMAVDGQVTLNISATDNSDDMFNTSAQVVIQVSPTITFLPNSYVEYKHVDVTSSNKYAIYLELRTKRTEGLILFQQGEAGEILFLELREGRLYFQHGSKVTEGVRVISDDQWYSVLLEKQDEISLQVWETQAETELVAEALSEAALLECDSQNKSQAPGLFIGGVDLFSLDESVRLRASEFVGTIRSVLINNTQIDLGCPTDTVNVMKGFHISNNACNTEQCENEHTAGCVDFTSEPYCKCIGGFPPASCQPLPNPDQAIGGSENSYAPIRFRGDSRADLQLDYSFFFDLEAQRRQLEPATITNAKRRKRAAQSNETIQTIHISFMLVNIETSVLLSSSTPSTTHRLEINGDDESMHAIIYTATDQNTMSNNIYIPVRLTLQTMTVYNVSVMISQENAIVFVKNYQEEKMEQSEWINKHTTFVEQPSTNLSIGGEESGHYFEGCIRRVAIDKIEIPLTGLLSLSPEEGGFMAGTKAPEMYCELCDVTTCSNNSECVRVASTEPVCTCQTGFTLVGSECILITIDPTLSVAVLPSSTVFIIAGSVSAVAVILLIAICIVIISTCCKKRARQKRTYSVTNMAVASGNNTTSKSNQYVHMEPRDNPIMTTLNTANGVARQDRGSSVSTFQEHAEDGDPEVESPRRLARRKSTVSAESGIRTDTDQEVSLKSIPRMEDSGNEKDTDYSEGDSGSDDLSSTYFAQPPPPLNLKLVSSGNSIPGMGSNVSSPHNLTPKERKIVTPLRPPSTALSASEYEDNHHGDDDEETDIEIGYPYSHHTLPSSLSRSSSARHSGHRGSNGGETSRVSSAGSGGSKWYKASTASDTERERERSRANKAYYTQRSEPGKYPVPPEYLSPPTFETRTVESKTMPYPNTRRSRMPINLVESPVPRNNKHAAYQFPYEPVQTPAAAARDPRLRYDNHRLKHEYSLPKGHPSVALSSASSSSGRPRHNAEAMLASGFPQSPPAITPHYPRHFSVSGPGSSIPHYTASYQYSRSYSSENKNKKEPEQKFQDLKSVATINPISYWEMQDKMSKTAVDQVDPYQILSEPYVQFEDVSTDPSVYESQITQDGPEHQHFCSQGGGERPVTSLMHHLSDSEMNDNSTIVSETDLAPRMPIFPSADCSSPYAAPLGDTPSSSGGSTPKLGSNVFAISSQHVFDV